jgi:uncharacterized radical SAM protein YgiQ
LYIPTSKAEALELGWKELDIILISGDVYIDSPGIGIAVIGHVLIDAGYRVGIIPQPSITSDKDITALGEPRLFWGISSGIVDSMVSNYNADRTKRKFDDLSLNGESIRPDRALIVYTGLIRRYFKNTVPIALGGIEASLRRVAHYDFWQNKIKRSILFDAKADILIYGMGEKSVIELANALDNHNLGNDNNDKNFKNIKGICYIEKNIEQIEKINKNPNSDNALILSSYDIVSKDNYEFEKMYKSFYKEMNSENPRRILQNFDDRYLVHNPPQVFNSAYLDKIYELPYEYDAHPMYKGKGEIRALETAKFSITTHRGCFGECSFCAISVHQGKKLISRSEKSILKEAKNFSEKKSFKGTINDLGGPTANMYMMQCKKFDAAGYCKNKSCLFPEVCENLICDHKNQIDLINKLAQISGIKKIFIRSGIRHDLIMEDKKNGLKYLSQILKDNISGQMRIAPEHVCKKVLNLMHKPSKSILDSFIAMFKTFSKNSDKKSHLSFYFIAAHPDCTIEDMKKLKNTKGLYFDEQSAHVQIFTPTPSTFSTLAYYTKRDPVSGKEIFVETEMSKKVKQKNILINKIK